MIRIFLYLITNLSITLILTLFFSITGIQHNNLFSLFFTSMIFGFIGSLISLLLSKWIAVHAVNGKIIKKSTKDITEIWLINIIKKYSQKSGIDIPDIAIYPSENINAFATGYQKNSSLIAVSTGLLNNMENKEIEAVIAHEITHINNGDMVTMTLIQGVVNTFVIFISQILTKILSRMIFFRENKENKDLNYYHIFFYNILSFTLELSLGLIANLIVMWFSRKREYYADAGSAKMVGSKNMIAALERLKHNYSSVQESSIISSLCIKNEKKSFLDLFLSHPSLDDRIIALKNKVYID